MLRGPVLYHIKVCKQAKHAVWSRRFITVLWLEHRPRASSMQRMDMLCYHGIGAPGTLSPTRAPVRRPPWPRWRRATNLMGHGPWSCMIKQAVIICHTLQCRAHLRHSGSQHAARYGMDECLMLVIRAERKPDT